MSIFCTLEKNLDYQFKSSFCNLLPAAVVATPPGQLYTSNYFGWGCGAVSAKTMGRGWGGARERAGQDKDQSLWNRGQTFGSTKQLEVAR